MSKLANSTRRAALCAALIAVYGLTAFAAPSAGLDGDVYYVSVPAGEVVSASDANWSTWASAASGHAFAKRGGGTLTSGAAMASFAGEIRIEGGIYAVSADGGLGTTAGGTVVSNNATLLIAGGTHASEPLYLSGTGCASGQYGGITLSNAGAVWRWSGGNKFNNVTLLGDATLRGNGSNMSGTLSLNGHALRLMLDGTQYLTLEKTDIQSMGNIVVERGGLWFSGLSATSGGDEWSVTVKANGFLYNWGTTSGAKLPWRLVFENGGSIRSGSGTVVWSGPVSIPYSVKVDRYTESWAGWFTGARLDGVVSGNGSLDIRNGEVLALTNSGNDFTGSISVNGINIKTNSTLKISNNALPSSSAGVSINYGNVELNRELSASGLYTNKCSLPKLTCTSSGTVACKDVLAVSGQKEIKEILKSGSGVLTLTGPLSVTGKTEVAEGTLRLGSRPPDVQTGLECYFYDFNHSPWYSKDNTGSWRYLTTNPDSLMRPACWGESNIQIPYVGIDTNGVSLAYKSWPIQFMDVVYKGYIWIDGDTPVTWNFAGCVNRHLWLRIDGADVIHNQDSYSPSEPMPYVRLSTSRAITLSPGAHEFWLYMANQGGTVQGPAYYTSKGQDSLYYWAPNIGVAYNPNPGDVISSNSTDYVKFTASQFSPTADRGKVNIDSSLYRASFEGGAKFATGTVFDIGDAAPYTPFTIENLEGAMTVTNGTLVLSGNWTIDAAEINAGGIILAGDANLVFAEGATLTVTNAGQILNVHRDGMPLVTCAGTGSVTGKPTILTDEKGWRIDEIGGNLNVHQAIGFVVTFR